MTMFRWCLLVLIGCHSTPVATPAPAAPPLPAPIATPPPLLFSAPAPPLANSKQICSTVEQPAVQIGGKLRTYDFSPTKLAPNPSDPIPVGYRRHPDSIRAAISAEADSIASCVQDASRRGVHTPVAFLETPHFELAATLTIDPFGTASTVTVDGGGDPKMRDCIRDVLRLARVARRTPRETVARVPLYLLGSYDGRKKLPKPQPVRTTPRSERAGCVLAIDPLPRDTLDVPEIVINWLPGEYRNPRQFCGTRDVDKAQIRRTMDDSRYAFEACFAASASTRGVVDLEFVIGSHGVPTNIAITGAGDAAMHACITAAMSNVGFQRVENPVLVHWSFSLDSPPSQLPTDCAGRAALVATYSMHDPRAWTAIDELAAAQCDFPESLDRYARLGVSDQRADIYRGRGLEEAIASSTKVLAAFPATAPRLLLFLADAQLSLGHEADARAAYLRFLALPNNDAKQIERAAEGYARAVAERDETSPLDFCEESAPY